MPRQIPKDPQRSPVRLLVSRWHNHTPEPLKCERGEKRGVYERVRANDKTIFIIKRGFRANDRTIFIRKRGFRTNDKAIFIRERGLRADGEHQKAKQGEKS